MITSIYKYTYMVLDTMLNGSQGVTQLLKPDHVDGSWGKYHRKILSF